MSANMATEAARGSLEGTNAVYACKGVGREDNAGEPERADPVLRGDRNQCRGCGRYFNSTGAFDAHRTGDFTQTTRHCLTEKQMLRKGMQLGGTGFWIRRAHTGRADWWKPKVAA